MNTDKVLESILKNIKKAEITPKQELNDFFANEVSSLVIEKLSSITKEKIKSIVKETWLKDNAPLDSFSEATVINLFKTLLEGLFGEDVKKTFLNSLRKIQQNEKVTELEEKL